MKYKIYKSDSILLKKLYLLLWITFIAQQVLFSSTLYNHQLTDMFELNKLQDTIVTDDRIKLQQSNVLFPGILFVEAGKKKKEKSEVVVISVNNPSKGHGGMYPIYIPTCGGSHGGGFGRKKR